MFGKNNVNNEYKQIKPFDTINIRRRNELIPYAQELIVKNYATLKEYKNFCEALDKENIKNLDEILKKDFEWLTYVLRGRQFVWQGRDEYDKKYPNVDACEAFEFEKTWINYNYDYRHNYERPEDLLGFDKPCQEMVDRIQEIYDEIYRQYQDVIHSYSMKHKNDETYLYSTSKREYDKFQKENEQIFYNYKKYREQHYGGELHSIVISVCQEFRRKNNQFLLTHYCPEYARNRAIVYKIFQHRGWELNDENKEKFKYELLERAYLRMASRPHKYYNLLSPCGKNIDYYENIEAYGGKDSTALAKVVLSFAGYVSYDHYEKFRKTSLDYIICLYPNILFDLFPIEEYKEHFYFHKIADEMTYNMEMYQYIFEERAYDITKSAKNLSTYPEETLAKSPINPPFMLESCIDRAERLKRQMKDYADTYDISKLKFASEYNRMKYEYGELVSIWTNSLERMLNTCYGNTYQNKKWEEKHKLLNIDEIPKEHQDYYNNHYYLSFEECFHTENDVIKQGRLYHTYTNRKKYECQKKEEYHPHTYKVNYEIEKEGRRPKITLYKATREGLKNIWEHQLGKYKDNSNWNILTFEDEEKDDYAFEHRPNRINSLDAKEFLDSRKKTKFATWDDYRMLDEPFLKYTPFLLEEEDTIISDDINKLFQIPKSFSSFAIKEFDYIEDYYDCYCDEKRKYEHFSFNINTYRTGIIRYTEEYLRLERLAVKIKNDANFNEAIESLQELIEMGYPKEDLIKIIDELEQKEQEYQEKRKTSEFFAKEEDDFEMH